MDARHEAGHDDYRSVDINRRHPRRPVTQYSRGSSVSIEKPRRTGYPAWGMTTSLRKVG